MSPFKEPQPRKTPEGGTPIVPKGVFPPYARLGHEARWESTDPKPIPKEWEPEQTPIMVLPDHSPFELRKAALEAACALQGNQPSSTFWDNIEAAENYLRDGTKPS